MASKRTIVIAGMTALSLGVAALATPVLASPAGTFDTKNLDAASADYTQYRHHRGWGGNRGAAVAAGVGLGVLGAAALAASRPAYADPYYIDDGYAYYGPRRPVYYEPAPVYEAPLYAPAPTYYNYGPDPRYRSKNGTTDPARGGR